MSGRPAGQGDKHCSQIINVPHFKSQEEFRETFLPHTGACALRDTFNCTYPSKSCHFVLTPYSLFEKKKKANKNKKKFITKKLTPPGTLGSTVPANVPISVKMSGPQALAGPKASGLDKQLVSASICCSVQGRDDSRRNRTAILQFEAEDQDVILLRDSQCLIVFMRFVLLLLVSICLQVCLFLIL